MFGHSFGLLHAVYNFNHRTLLVSKILNKIFGVCTTAYYDDRYGFCRLRDAHEEQGIIKKLCGWLSTSH